MIEIGKKQKLIVAKTVDFGVYLAEEEKPETSGYTAKPEKPEEDLEKPSSDTI